MTDGPVFTVVSVEDGAVRPLDEAQARERIDRKRRQRAAYKRTDKGRQTQRRYRMKHRAGSFVGIDGEANTNGDYVLLRCGDRLLYRDEAPLGWRECLDFICDLPTGRDYTYVGFFFDYDVTMILRGLVSEQPGRVVRLLDRESRTRHGRTLPVDVGRFQLEYLPTKEFKVRRKNGSAKSGYDSWRRINDVGSFFQCSFAVALRAWNVGSPDELALIDEGKANRGAFPSMTPRVQLYNETEIKLLEQLMHKLAASYMGIDAMPYSWQGPGQLAAALFNKEGIPRRQVITDYVPLDVFEAGNAAYYGGRFETTAVGHLPPVKQWDINSAYPDAIRRLPCLIHGEWTLSDKPESNLWLGYGSFQPTLEAMVSGEIMLWGLPFRLDDGGIIHPASGRGWYWSPEVESSIHQRFTPEQVWSYHRRCECQPFAFVPSLYGRRKQLEKQSDATSSNMGISLKLGLNSMYGKFAQSVGSAPYANSVYASLICAHVRARINWAIHELSDCADPEKAGGFCGHCVYYVATDGLFTSSERVLSDSGTGLGQWSHNPDADVLSGILLVQSGVYISADNSRLKTRGIPKRMMLEWADVFRAAWDELHRRHFARGTRQNKQSWTIDRYSVSIPFHQFMGVRQAVSLGRIGEAGEWKDIPRRYSFEWQRKRDRRRFYVEDRCIRTRPIPGKRTDETMPYRKDIGNLVREHREWFGLAPEVWWEAQPPESDMSLVGGLDVITEED